DKLSYFVSICQKSSIIEPRGEKMPMAKISDGGRSVAASTVRGAAIDGATLDQRARRATGRTDSQTRADLPTRLAYGFGAAAYGAKLQLFGLLLLFYNQLIGLPAATVSLVLAISVVIDAIWDPIVGQLSDHTRTRLGRRHPYLYSVAIPLAL